MLQSFVLPTALFLSIQQFGGPVVPPEVEFPPQDQGIQSLVYQGRTAKLAARHAAEAAKSPETIRVLAQAHRFDDMLRVLRSIVDTEPARIADAFEALGEAVWQFRAGDELARRRADALHQIVADARKQLPGLPREDAARAERVFISVDAERSPDRRNQPSHLVRFIEQYRGTQAALLTEVDVINWGSVSQQMFDSFDAFIAAHPGTAAAAKALYLKGFQWHTINTLGRLEPRGADPTARFMRVLAIVTELESGKYPKSEWVDKAPTLIVGFFMPEDAKIAPENLDRLIEAHREFVRSHFALDERYPDQSGIGYLVTSKMGDLFARHGDRIAGVEQVFDELERTVKDPSGVRYLRALFYMRPDRRQSKSGPAMLDKARQVLTTLSASGRDLYHRKALATLAAMTFADRDYARARELFAKYAAAYPESSWSWVALLRVGQCHDGLGDPKAAAATYLEAVRKFGDLPPARVLGEEYAARAYEATSELESAVNAHQRALDGWDNAYGLRYSTFVRNSVKPDDAFIASVDEAEVSKEALTDRIAQLKRSLSAPGGARLERGRWLLRKGRHQEAVAELKRLQTEYPTSPMASEGRELIDEAQFEHALQLADVERPSANEAAALAEFEALARSGHGFAVTAAAIARASLLWKQGDAPAAEKVMSEALTAWHAAQRWSKPAAGLASDVAEIRRAVFLPRGGGVYANEQWNAFSWPSPPPPFTLVNADVRVKRHDGEVTRVTLVQELPGATKLLFFDTRQISLLKRTIVALGGTRSREPRQVMETPNQPVGDSMQILKFWTKFFAGRPGHWGGWEIETYPVITEIEFTNAERTKASARVTIGYSGGTVELEKEAGTWIAKRFTNQWIT